MKSFRLINGQLKLLSVNKTILIINNVGKVYIFLSLSGKIFFITTV